jgi:heme/copper-type cytochrome/quinol oxidase subunit 4
MTEGLAEFRKFLKEYGALLAAGAPIAATPLIAGFAAMSPPWPSNISFVTAVVQLVVLILIFQMLGTSSRRVINRVILASFACLMLVSLGYIYLLRNFTYDAQVDVKGTIERRVKGFVCKDVVQREYPDACPFLGASELNEVQNRPDMLWTESSRNNVHVALVTTWALSFIALTTVVGSFLVYQRRMEGRQMMGKRPMRRPSRRNDNRPQ